MECGEDSCVNAPGKQIFIHSELTDQFYGCEPNGCVIVETVISLKCDSVMSSVQQEEILKSRCYSSFK